MRLGKVPITAVSISLLAVVGCGTGPRTETVRQSLLPAPPLTLESIPLIADDIEPPAMPARQPSRRTPRILVQDSERSQTDMLVASAEQHVRSGRDLVEAGDRDRARQEFDLAVEALLAAPATNPATRARLDQKLNEFIDAIHEYDIEETLPASQEVAGAAAENDPLPEAAEAIAARVALENANGMTFPIDPQFANQVLEEVRATASQLPLDVNDEVLTFLRYFQTRQGRRVIVNGLTRMGMYRDLVYRIFDEEGVPRELIHLAQAESGFHPRAISRARATGMWQFMQFRGREYGLMQDRYKEDRFNPEKSSRAAARHLRDLFARFGDWYLVLAAYNWGPENVARAVERTGYADFWELRRRGALPRETSNHVPIIVAMTIMAKNPSHYGLEELEPLPPLVHEDIEIDSLTSLQLIADMAGTSVEELQRLNPSLLQKVVPPGYLLRVPQGRGRQLRAALDLVPGKGRSTWRAHKVGEGETLAMIARRYRTTAGQIASVNTVDEDLRAGDLLLIPLSR